MNWSHISVRVDDIIVKSLDKACSLRGEVRSSYIRRALLRELARHGMLPEEQTRALEDG